MTEALKKVDRKLYRQGIASLRIEGMALDKSQNRIVMEYHTNRSTHSELLLKAVKYAESK